MAVDVSTETLREALNSDSEFRLQARYWDGVLQFEFADDVRAFSLAGGEILDQPVERVNDGTPRSAIIAASYDEWAEFLQPYPKPGFHELFPASHLNGFELLGDPDYVWAYYAALRRAGEVLRGLVNEKGV